MYSIRRLSGLCALLVILMVLPVLATIQDCQYVATTEIVSPIWYLNHWESDTCSNVQDTVRTQIIYILEYEYHSVYVYATQANDSVNIEVQYALTDLWEGGAQPSDLDDANWIVVDTVGANLKSFHGVALPVCTSIRLRGVPLTGSGADVVVRLGVQAWRYR